MKKRVWVNIILIICFYCLEVSATNIKKNDDDTLQAYATEKVEQWLSTQNESGFLENCGQMVDAKGNPNSDIFFLIEAPNLNFWITKDGISIQTLHWIKEAIPEKDYSDAEREQFKVSGKIPNKKILEWERIDIKLKNGQIKKENIIKEERIPTRYSYYYSFCPDGVNDVYQYRKITIKDVYPGIDWVFYRKEDGTLKYDFIVHPGADYRQIELLFYSKKPVALNSSGQLEMSTQYGSIREEKPVSFYKDFVIETNFAIQSLQEVIVFQENVYETSVSFQCLFPFDESVGFDSDFIIDPQLYWGTFIGGNGWDGVYSITAHAGTASVFVSGYSVSSSAPTIPTFDPGGGSYYTGTAVGSNDMFILKFDVFGELLWGTYYGSLNADFSFSVSADPSGDVYIAGYTGNAASFPVFNPGGGAYFQAAGGSEEAVIVKFTNNGVRLWATFYGGSSGEYAYAVHCDDAGNVYLSGITGSANLPVLNPGGGAYFQAANGGGKDAYVVKFNSNCVRQWATYYGGSADETCFSITSDATGNIYLTGNTLSADFPVVNPGGGAYFQAANAGLNDIFILKFSSTGVRQWATCYGGADVDYGYTCRFANAVNYLYVFGTTNSTDLPTLNPGGGAFYQGVKSTNYDAFLLKFSDTGGLLWGTYFGGTGLEEALSYDNLAINPCGNVYMSMATQSSLLPCPISCDGGYRDISRNGKDVYITLFDNAGVQLWGSYIGSWGTDFRSPIVDVEGLLFISGEWTNMMAGDEASYPLLDPGLGAYYDPTYNNPDDSYMVSFDVGDCMCQNLPVSMLSFFGNAEEGFVKLQWKTASETNNSHFEIQRNLFENFSDESNDDYWIPIGKVNGNGTSNSISVYEFIDPSVPSPADGVVYYRLKQVDFDGKYEFIGPISIDFESFSEIQQMQLFPNPASNLVTVFVKTTSQCSAYINLLNSSGIMVESFLVESVDNMLVKEIDLSAFPEGLYFIQFLTDDGGSETQKLLINKY